MVWEGDGTHTLGTFNKVVVQVNLLFGLEIWAMTSNIGRILGGFHHQVDHRITVMKTKRDKTRRWDYPHMEVEMATSGL